MAEQSDWLVLVMAYLFKLLILALLLERGLFFLFDYSLWRKKIKDLYLRAPISFLVAWSITYWYDLDILSPTLDPGSGSTYLGVLITALIVAGGSAGLITLMQDILKQGRTARNYIQALEKEKHKAELKKISSKGE